MSKVNIDALLEDQPTTVEPSIVPTQTELPMTETKEGFNPELNSQHPLNRPANIPKAPTSFCIRTDGGSPEEEIYAYVQEHFEILIPLYETGFIPVGIPTEDKYKVQLEWKYSPDMAESTLMQYHNAKQTMNIQSFRDKVNQVIIERVEERDATRVRQFVEVVNYDVEACRPILEGDSGFLSEIASMDVVDFNLKYLQVKELQILNKTMHMILESLAKLTQGIPT